MKSDLFYIIVVALILFFIIYKFLQRDVKEKNDFYALLLTTIAILTASIFNSYQIQQQNNQYLIDNRPSLFLSGALKGQKTDEFQTFRFKIKNSGKLPAKINRIVENIVIAKKEVNLDDEEFNKIAYVFPQQENMYIDALIPNALMSDMIKNSSFIMKLKIDYYSINDRKENNRFYYYLEQEFSIDKNSFKLIPGRLIKIDAH